MAELYKDDYIYSAIKISHPSLRKLYSITVVMRELKTLVFFEIKYFDEKNLNFKIVMEWEHENEEVLENIIKAKIQRIRDHEELIKELNHEESTRELIVKRLDVKGDLAKYVAMNTKKNWVRMPIVGNIEKENEE